MVVIRRLYQVRVCSKVIGLAHVSGDVRGRKNHHQELIQGGARSDPPQHLKTIQDRHFKVEKEEEGHRVKLPV